MRGLRYSRRVARESSELRSWLFGIHIISVISSSILEKKLLLEYNELSGVGGLLALTVRIEYCPYWKVTNIFF